MYEVGFAPLTFEPIIREELNAHLILWDERGIEICDLPPAREAMGLAPSAVHRYRADRHGDNREGCRHCLA